MAKHTSVSVRFLHDGKLAGFDAKFNKLSGDWLHTFDAWRNAYVSDLGQVKRIINQIRANDADASITWQA